MKVNFYEKPKRNPYGQGPFSDRIILDSKKNDFGTSGDSVFESSSFTAENQKNLLDRFFYLSEAGSDEGICPSLDETGYDSTDSPWMDKFCDMFSFFIPESGGGYCCTDPSQMVATFRSQCF